MMLRAGMAILSAMVAGTLGAEELPSILSAEGRAFLTGATVLEEDPMHLLSTREMVQAGGGEEELPQVQASVGEEKSPRRAFLYSVLLPGLGEWYAGSKKRALAFFGVEAVVLGLWSSWKGKGNDLEQDFREVADEHWDPENYLAWRDMRDARRNNSFTHALPCSSDVVEVYIPSRRAMLNAKKDGTAKIPKVDFGGCAATEIQQYYELIGKYDIFQVGWDDLTDMQTGNTIDIASIDSVESSHSDRRLVYEGQRNESNKYLKRASTLTGLLLVNHVISAIDAARVARARSEGVDEAVLRRRTRVALVMHPWDRGQVPMLMAYKPFD